MNFQGGMCIFEASLEEASPVRYQHWDIERRAIIFSSIVNCGYDVTIDESRDEKLTSR